MSGDWRLGPPRIDGSNPNLHPICSRLKPVVPAGEHAGGTGIFNALQVTWIDAYAHMSFFSSCAAREAESVWGDFRDELVSLGKEGMER